MEIKGSAGTQRIPLDLQPGWTDVESPLDWPKVGTLSEVVLVVNRVGDGESASGAIDLDVQLRTTSPGPGSSARHPAARIVGVLFVSLVVSMLVSVAAAFGGDEEGRRTQGTGLWRDFVLGAGVVSIACLGVVRQPAGLAGALEVGWTAIWVAFAGAGVAEWLKFGLTGKHLSAAEVFRDMVATGVLAASTSALAILQAPGSWPEMLLLSQSVAARRRGRLPRGQRLLGSGRRASTWGRSAGR